MFPDRQFAANGYPIESGVRDQPMSCAETLQGATNRARQLRPLSDADYVVGIEGGIEIIDDSCFASAWIVIIDHAGRIARGRSGSFALPPRVQALIEKGMELGHANDQVFGELNSKHAGGAVGSLSGGVITRQSLYEHAMQLALIAYRQPALF